MSRKTPTSLQAKHALASVAFFARVLLHSSVLFVVALFPCTEPGIGLLNSTESEAPVDQDESSEEEAISEQARTGVGRDQPGSPLPVPVRVGLSLTTVGIARVPNSGHRLPNNLLAPLRC
jgi:hypothetical protein